MRLPAHARNDGPPPPGGEAALRAEAESYSLFRLKPWEAGAAQASPALVEFVAAADDGRYAGWPQAFTHARIVTCVLSQRIQDRYWRLETGMHMAGLDQAIPVDEAESTQSLIDAVALSRVTSIPRGGSGEFLGDEVHDSCIGTLQELGADPTGNRLRVPGGNFQSVAHAILLGNVQVGQPSYTYNLSDMLP